MFKAIYLKQAADKTTERSLRTLEDVELPSFDINLFSSVDPPKMGAN